MDFFGLEKEQRTLGACLAIQASLRPQSEYLICNERSWSYQQFNEWVNIIAGGLLALGLKKSDKLAIMLRNSPEFMALWFACARIGVVEVPVNTSYRGPLLRHLIENSDARMAVIEEGYIERFQNNQVGFGKLEKLVLWSDGSERRIDLPLPIASFDMLTKETTPFLQQDVSNLDPMAILYSSGTTGPSKGIQLCHNYFWWHGVKTAQNRNLGSHDRIYTCLPLFHGNAQMLTAVPALMAGAAMILDERFSASTFWDRLRAGQATQFNYIGGMIPILMKQPRSDADRQHSIRLAVGAGAPTNLWRDFESRFGIDILEGYGQTENCIALFNPLNATRIGSVGLPICGFEVDLVDDQDKPVDVATIGELVFRPQEPYIMMDGYYKNPEATLAQSSNLWFHSGDLMKKDADGYYYFIDRKKDAMRRRGENISAFEVEMVINSHDCVLESAAIAVPSEVGEDEVMICVVLKPDRHLAPEELIRYCEELLPYFAVPRFVDFRAELPKTPTHRVEKYRLRDQGVTETTWDREKAGYILRR